MTLKANGVTCLRRTVLPQGSLYRPELRAVTALSDFRVRSAHDNPRVIVPARRLLLRRRVGGC